MTATIPAARATAGTQRRPTDVRLCCIGIENVSSLSKGSRYPRAIHNTPGFNRAEAFIFASRNTPGDRTLASAGLTASVDNCVRTNELCGASAKSLYGSICSELRFLKELLRWTKCARRSTSRLPFRARWSCRSGRDPGKPSKHPCAPLDAVR